MKVIIWQLLSIVFEKRQKIYCNPNLIPLPASAVERIVQAVEPSAYERIYGGWFDRVVVSDAKAAVARSAARYIQAISTGLS